MGESMEEKEKSQFFSFSQTHILRHFPFFECLCNVFAQHGKFSVFYSFQPPQFVNLSCHLLALICASVLVVVLMAYFLGPRGPLVLPLVECTCARKIWITIYTGIPAS